MMLRLHQNLIRINLNGAKKEAFIGFYSTKSTEGKTLYKLVKSVISELNLDLKIIVGKAFADGAADMNGVHKGLSTRMEECSPLGIYVHCYGHVLKLALQDTMTQILEPGSVQLLRSESPTPRPVWQHRSRR